MGPRTRRKAKSLKDTGADGTSSAKDSKVAKASEKKGKTPATVNSRSQSTGYQQTRVASRSAKTASKPTCAGVASGDDGFDRLSGDVSPKQAKEVITTPSTEAANSNVGKCDGQAVTGRDDGAMEAGLIDHGPTFSNVHSGEFLMKFKKGLMPPSKSSTPAAGRRPAPPSAAGTSKGTGADGCFGFDDMLESDNDDTLEFPSSINMSKSFTPGKSLAKQRQLAEGMTSKEKQKNRSDWLTVLNDCGILIPSGSRGNATKGSSNSTRNSEPVKEPELFVDDVNPFVGRKRQKKQQEEDKANDMKKIGKRKRHDSSTDSPDTMKASSGRRKQCRLDCDDDSDGNGKDQKIVRKKEGKENVARLRKEITGASKFKLTVQ